MYSVVAGLPSHPQHELAKRQCTGCTGMVSFYIKGALKHAETFLKSLKVSSKWVFPLRLPFTGSHSLPGLCLPVTLIKLNKVLLAQIYL